jgi:hypothetical protein
MLCYDRELNLEVRSTTKSSAMVIEAGSVIGITKEWSTQLMYGGIDLYGASRRGDSEINPVTNLKVA